jgi:hypothetical protein
MVSIARPRGHDVKTLPLQKALDQCFSRRSVHNPRSQPSHVGRRWLIRFAERCGFYALSILGTGVRLRGRVKGAAGSLQSYVPSVRRAPSQATSCRLYALRLEWQMSITRGAASARSLPRLQSKSNWNPALMAAAVNGHICVWLWNFNLKPVICAAEVQGILGG